MNKLVIVGNGFDLAHGLPTSYKDFIDDFWSSLKFTFEEDNIKKIVHVDPLFTGLVEGEINNFTDFKTNLGLESDRNNYQFNKSEFIVSSYNTYGEKGIRFKFTNIFFKDLNAKTSIENWVDIENEYYQQLKIISKRKITNFKDKEAAEKKQIIKNKDSVVKLNQEFEEIKVLFKEYLLKKVESAYSFTNFNGRNYIALHDFLKPISLFNNETYLLDEFQLKEDKKIIENLFQEEKKGKEKTTDTFILNFNYTLTTSQYIYDIYKDSNYSDKIIHIHGLLSNKTDNQMNFGFGDEMDDDYKLIENLNDKEYLQNFKSFKYSQNSNYQNLLRIIESGKFQVYIMGHSCGLSDRTLLNTIFEHDNCRSIKIFYYDRGDGSDNFTEIVQNISRHFNNKKVMREKIVNKSLCKPLPQNIRFQEKQS